MKGINFHTEKNLAHAHGMQNVHLSVCLSGSKNGITFDPLCELK